MSKLARRGFAAALIALPAAATAEPPSTDERWISNVNAVTDARAPGVSTAAAFPGEGRAVFAGLSWRY
ncbi:MAG: hypothetical protein RBS50_08495 [Phenylobacterium sp.]|jgi:hypothetical protein|uniref:hypothetical protein n=1 Tax=Phenylobacterium sp. TaxID=1871053 RepID=UPI002A3589D3|nr:hypothetical protein [Phenylobacterium sp.]MDX9997987.1 hypothetical protein [Phenylobacterium sp.]